MTGSRTDWAITYRSIVLPKHCDHYGHMNVRFYAEHFDDGGFQMWQAAGVKQSELTRDGMGIVVANISIDFIHEITAGQLMEIRGAWIRVGGKKALPMNNGCLRLTAAHSVPSKQPLRWHLT